MHTNTKERRSEQVPDEQSGGSPPGGRKPVAQRGAKFITEKELVELMDRRGEELRELIKSSDKKFEELTSTMSRRFEESDKRFKELIEASDRRFEENIRRLEAVIAGQRTLVDEVKAGFGSLGARSGIDLERTILNILRKALELRGIDVNKVEKKSLRDEKGDFYAPGEKVDMDMYVHDGAHIFFEVKYRVEGEDVAHFYQKSKFFENKLGVKAQKVMIAILIDQEAREMCKRHGIEIITRE